MIVISGALVLVALVLLLIGLLQPDLTFVYASIAVSLVSFAFLTVGILQRRREQPEPAGSGDAPGGSPTPAAKAVPPVDPDEGITAVIPASSPVATAEVTPAAPSSEQKSDVVGDVLVVEGRPRYHVDGCRYLSGRTVEEMDVADAREDGFTACGVCEPDLALKAAQQEREPVKEPEQVEEPEQFEELQPAQDPEHIGKTEQVGEPDQVEEPEQVEEPDQVATTRATSRRVLADAAPAAAVSPPIKPRQARAGRAARPAAEVLAPAEAAALTTRAVTKAPAGRTPAKRSATSAAPAGRPAKAAVRPAPDAEVVAPTKASVPAKASVPTKAPSPVQRTAAKATTRTRRAEAPAPQIDVPAATVAPAAVPAAGRKGAVVVIPNRGRFHRADCRYVRGNADAETLSRAQATRQGYEVCGVCTP